MMYEKFPVYLGPNDGEYWDPPVITEDLDCTTRDGYHFSITWLGPPVWVWKAGQTSVPGPIIRSLTDQMRIDMHKQYMDRQG